ncbi:MAG: GNAT family N-acetyltransferase [Candidatus Thorarchaeota archaeon]|nr:GNAT family N-acetyltransferase [Candidatus Thorarchaeota archaeon]
MSIRSFESQDIKQVVNLANSYSSFDSDVTEADFQPAWSFPRGLLVAEDDEHIVGFVFAYLREVPGEVLNRWAASKVAQIEILVVDSSYRDRGIGKALLDRLLEILREEGVDMVLLHCPTEAIEAKHLYDKLGFEVRAYDMRKRL